METLSIIKMMFSFLFSEQRFVKFQELDDDMQFLESYMFSFCFLYVI